MHTSAHAISLIGPWASVQRIDYESHPLISRGLKSAFALNEVTFAWLRPSHIPWPWRVTTGRSMCIFLYVQAMMWEEINGNGTDQSGGLDIWLSDISDTSVRRPAVASSVNCQFHLSEVLNITVSWGSAMQLSSWCSQGAPPSLLQPPDVARSALRVSKLTLNSENKNVRKNEHVSD